MPTFTDQHLKDSAQKSIRNPLASYKMILNSKLQTYEIQDYFNKSIMIENGPFRHRRRQTSFHNLRSLSAIASEELRNLAVGEHLAGQIGEKVTQRCGQVVLCYEVRKQYLCFWWLYHRSRLTSAWKSRLLAGISAVARTSSIWGACEHRRKHRMQTPLCHDNTRCIIHCCLEACWALQRIGIAYLDDSH